MSTNKTLAAILENSERTVARWKKEERPIVALLEKYFNEEDLQEFLTIQKISKFDLLAYTLNLQNQKLAKFYFYMMFDFELHRVFSISIEFLKDNNVYAFDNVYEINKIHNKKYNTDINAHTFNRYIFELKKFLEGLDGNYLATQAQNDFSDLKNFLRAKDEKLELIFDIVQFDTNSKKIGDIIKEKELNSLNQNLRNFKFENERSLKILQTEELKTLNGILKNEY